MVTILPSLFAKRIYAYGPMWKTLLRALSAYSSLATTSPSRFATPSCLAHRCPHHLPHLRMAGRPGWLADSISSSDAIRMQSYCPAAPAVRLSFGRREVLLFESWQKGGDRRLLTAAVDVHASRSGRDIQPHCPKAEVECVGSFEVAAAWRSHCEIITCVSCVPRAQID